MAEQAVERFAPSGGRVTGTLGLVVAVVIVVLGILDRSVPLVVVAVALLVGVLIWASMLRPRVLVTEGTLVLRNMMETVHIPLAAVEDLSVRQVLAVRTARRRYVSPGVGRTVRQSLKSTGPGSPAEATRPALGPAFGGSAPSQVEPGMAYADFVELRLRDLVEKDRNRRGVRGYSPEAEALAGDVRREPAWVEILALGGAIVFVLVTVLF